MSRLPQTKNDRRFTPRPGQEELIRTLPDIQPGGVMSVQWPTGYGKSLGFALAWKHCFDNSIANRLLLIVANDTQREQIITDFAGDCRLIDAQCRGGVWAFERSASDLIASRDATSVVFVTTVQALDASVRRGGVNTLVDMLRMPRTKWMIGFDEYHHYGEDMPWGDSAKSIMKHAAFTMAMSATPYRRGSDTVFPPPNLCVTYSQAVTDKCVKPMVCESYSYTVTVIDDEGTVTTYSTDELMEKNGSTSGLQTWEERKGIRYSSQYIEPLVVNPILRLGNKISETGIPLQMIIRAMSCRHAKSVCDQVRTLTEMSVDWIGTGFDGRTDDDNRSIRKRFCPEKNAEGVRGKPSLDILVQVSMAGEGFDSVNVCEIVDLYPVSKKALNGKATQDKQCYGRGSRIVPGARNVKLHISVPSDHPLHKWAGFDLHQWMDAEGEAVEPPDESTKEREQQELPWPEPPKKRQVTLQAVNRESEPFKAFSAMVGQECGIDDLSQHQDKIESMYANAQRGIAIKQSEQDMHQTMRVYLDTVIGKAAVVMSRYAPEVSSAVIGKNKKQLNSELIRRFRKRRDEMTTDEMKQAADMLQKQYEKMGNRNGR